MRGKMAINELDSKSYRRFTKKSELDKAVHTLVGIIQGIVADYQVSPEEIEELSHWCSLHKNMINKHPFNELIPLIEECISDNQLTNEEIEDILWVCKNFDGNNEYYDIITSDIQKLQGILHGILADGEISDSEVKILRDWLEDNDHLAKTYPYDEIYSLVISVLKDGKIDSSERDTLKVYFSDFIDMRNSYNLIQPEIDELKKQIKIEGICSMCPVIEFENKTFCFTGASEKVTRSKFAEIVTSLGANFNNSVTKTTDYLVVGADGNPCWAFSCYGRKVEKAIQLRKNGHNVIIVHENDFWDAAEDLGYSMTAAAITYVNANEVGQTTTVVTDNEDVDLF
jgi:hypothetical protein